MKHSHGVQTIEELFNESTEQHTTPNPFSSLLAFLTASVTLGLLASLLILPLAVPIAAAPGVAKTYWEHLPKELPEVSLPQRSHIYSADGQRIATFYSENRIEVNLEDIAPTTIAALIATEDARFYDHNGVDFRGIARAFKNNTLHGDQEGASTITQQLVKNTLLLAATDEESQRAATEVSYARKIDEISYAVALEDTMTKDEILERYLNTVLFSNGVYGIGTAAQYYFGEKAENLSVAQSALLIGLLKNPSAYNPITHPDAAVERRAVVLSRMVAVGAISEAEAEEANNTPLELDVTKTPNGCGESAYPFYCQWVVDSLMGDERLGDTKEERAARLHLGGLKITTPLNREQQKQLQKDVDALFGRDNRVAIGVAMVEPGTGNVTAMAQNRSWGEGVDKKTGHIKTQIVLPATRAYQSGSSFKPITLAAALESGMPHNATINAPTVFNRKDMNTPTGGIKNLSLEAAGNLTIDKATAISSNTWFAELQYNVGVLNVADMARNLGISVPGDITSKDASFTLGTTDTSPLEMAAAYATFAAQGLYCPPRSVESITSSLGELNAEENKCRQAITPGTANRVTQALKGTIDSKEKNRTGKLASIGRPAAGKSGTTNAHSAAWFVGYTPQLSTAVWIGDPRGGFKYPLTSQGGVRYNGSMVSNVYASKIAAPAWKRIMGNAMSGEPRKAFEAASNSSTVSPPVVPDVRGMTLENAVGVLREQGFTVTFKEETVDAPEGMREGQVAKQSPQGGVVTFNPDSMTVTLTATNGSDIPDVIR